MVSAAAFQARVRGFVSQSRRFERNKNVSSPSTSETQYCEEPPCPRGIVLALRLPGFAFRILCLEGSVISLISPSSGVSPGLVRTWACPFKETTRDTCITDEAVGRSTNAPPPSLPSRNETLNQRLLNVGLSSATPAQHQAKVGSMSRPPLL